MDNEQRRDTCTEIQRLMEAHGTGLLRLCTLYLKDPFLAQDAVQETFLKAYRFYGTFRGDAEEKTWLTSIARNVCRDFLRTAWFRTRSKRICMDETPEISDGFVFPDDTVLTEVMRLPVKYREVILLRYYQGLKLRETAEALHLKQGAVRNRLKRANELLRSRLKEWYDEI